MRTDKRYDVGGVLMRQPFKIRRLGHFGLNFDDFAAAKRLYLDDLGFRMTDVSLVPGCEEQAIFSSHNSDHHSLVIAPAKLAAKRSPPAPGVTLNQMSWEVGTLDEIAHAIDYLGDQNVKMVRSGRDIPGSNWHVYFLDPDAHVCELYFGMEQIGWNRLSKPTLLHERRMERIPPLPFMTEDTEVNRAIERGVDMGSGFRPDLTLDAPYDVGGVLLPRPFRITGHGPIGLYVRNVAESLGFYTQILGFKVTETVDYDGYECIFLRNGTEHHSLSLAPIELRERLGGNPASTAMSLGIKVGSYRQLRAAAEFLRERAWVPVENFPIELHPGIDYAVHFQDHEGHCLQLYYYMEQIGWDGRPRPVSERRRVLAPWPDALEELSDTYADQGLAGPL